MAMIEFRNVSKTYCEGDDLVQALDNTSFSINEKDFIAIMGPSGCGKSTLLSILGVLNKPSGGEVFIEDTEVYNLKPERQADFRFEFLGFVFQSFQLVPYLTVIENVMIPLSIAGISERDQRKMAGEVLEKVNLEDKVNRLPNQISGGEGQRVAIARAIVNNPPILLADEPTGNLDSKHGGEIMNLLEELNEEGQTIVMVTHDKTMAKYAHKLIELIDGRILNEA